MIDRITELLNELEQEINDGYNTSDYQTNDEGKTYINRQNVFTLYELQNKLQN